MENEQEIDPLTNEPIIWEYVTMRRRFRNRKQLKEKSDLIMQAKLQRAIQITKTQMLNSDITTSKATELIGDLMVFRNALKNLYKTTRQNEITKTKVFLDQLKVDAK